MYCLQENGRLLRQSLEKGVVDKEDVMFKDYCNMMRPSAYVSEREALRRLEWENGR